MPTDAARALTIQLLEWLSARPRTYAETLEVWRTTCPRSTIWEDARIDGLVECARSGDRVEVTEKGRMLLQALHGRPS
jgi:hypothetical protein